jgi:hypothetical protein
MTVSYAPAKAALQAFWSTDIPAGFKYRSVVSNLE